MSENSCRPSGIVPSPSGPHPVCANPNGPPSVTQLDAKLPKTPKYKGSIWPSYDYVLPSQSTVRLLAAFTYISEIWNDALNTPELRRPASRTLDASIHYISSGGMSLRAEFGGK